MSTRISPEIMTAAIEGFEAQKQRIDSQIAELRAMLNGPQPTAAAAPQTTKRSTMSAAGRKRIAEAQRKRWAEAKGVSVPAAPATKPKRKLSAAGRAAIVTALKKRWAEKRAASGKLQAVAASKAPRKRTVTRKAA